MKSVCAAIALALLAPLMSRAQTSAAPTAAKPRSLYYLTAPLPDYAALLPGPPAAGSDAANADMAAARLVDKSRTPQQVAAAQHDAEEESMFLYANVFGPMFTPAQFPLIAALGVHLRAEVGVVNPPLKVHFGRHRPPYVDKGLHAVCPSIDDGAYPSGHSANGYLYSMVLAQMVPERAPEILQRADDYAHNRVVCGVHFPSDTQASRTLSLVLFGELASTPRFNAEMLRAQTELRSNLGLPAKVTETAVR